MQAQSSGKPSPLRIAAVPSADLLVGESLSLSLWDLDWAAHLPLRIADDAVVEQSSFRKAMPFIAENFKAMFDEDPAESPFMQGGSTEAKARYYDRCGDFFEFKVGGDTVGVMVCTPIDWSTYYMRFSAFLPAYQGRQLAQRFFPLFFSVLRAAGVERVEAETSPSNLAVMHILNRHRFNPTGTILSERWGALVRLTKFLDNECEEVFLRQFCTGIKYQVRKS